MNKLISCALMVAGILLLVFDQSYSQHQPVYTQYMFNETAFNPAYAGVPERLSLTGLYRKQWVGIEGAPTTQTLAIHAPVTKKSLALGLQVQRDEIGVYSRTEIKSLYAYRIRFNEVAKLSMGLQTGVSWFNDQFGQVYEETDDPEFSENFREAHFLFGAGVYYHTDRFYVGGSIPVIQTKAKRRNHYYFTTGYVLDMGSHLKLKPNMMIKLADNAPIAFDLNTNLLIQEIIWLGLSYRSQESVGVLTQFQFTKELNFGYAYDVPVAGISSYGSGSHEISLTYRIKVSPFAYKSPRFF